MLPRGAAGPHRADVHLGGHAGRGGAGDPRLRGPRRRAHPAARVVAVRQLPRARRLAAERHGGRRSTRATPSSTACCATEPSDGAGPPRPRCRSDVPGRGRGTVAGVAVARAPSTRTDVGGRRDQVIMQRRPVATVGGRGRSVRVPSYCVSRHPLFLPRTALPRTEVVVSRRRRAVTRSPLRHALLLGLIAVLAGAGVGTAILMPRVASPTGLPPVPPPLSAPPVRGTRRSRAPPARRLLPRRRRRPGSDDRAHRRRRELRRALRRARDGPRRHDPRPGGRHLRRRLHRAGGQRHARGSRGRPRGERGQGGHRVGLRDRGQGAARTSSSPV